MSDDSDVAERVEEVEDSTEEFFDTIEDTGNDVRETIDRAEQTAQQAQESAADLFGEDRVDRAMDSTQDLFDNLDDAAPPPEEAARAAIETAPGVMPGPRRMLRILLGAIPVFLGLVLLGIPTVPTALAGGLLSFSLLLIAVVTLSSRFRGTSEARDVSAGSLVGLVFGSVGMALIQLAVLALGVIG